VGQLAEPPPKQRQMWFASCLQTAFLPSQQFCDAFVAPLPPQMLPGGLHDWPFVQVWSFFELESHSGAVAGGPYVPSQKTP
jgi:hypothetical protein